MHFWSLALWGKQFCDSLYMYSKSQQLPVFLGTELKFVLNIQDCEWRMKTVIFKNSDLVKID